MRKILLFLSLGLAALTSFAAPTQPVTQADIQQLHQQLRTQEKDLSVLREITLHRLSIQDSRVNDLNASTANNLSAISNLSTIVGFAITVITFVAGFIGYVSAKRKAVTEAKEAVEKWFNENSANHTRQIADLEKSRDDIKRKLSTFQEETDALQVLVLELKRTSKTIQDSINQEESSVKATAHNARELIKKATESSSFELLRNLNSPKVASPIEDGAPSSSANPLIAEIENLLREASNQLDHNLAIEIYEKLSQRFGNDNSIEIQALVAEAIISKGLRLDQLNRSEEEIETYKNIDIRYSGNSNPILQEKVARALVNMGVSLGHLGRIEESIAVYDEIEKRYANEDSDELREIVARALGNKGVMLDSLGRSTESIEIYRRIDRKYSSDKSPKTRENVARALLYLGLTLDEVERTKEAIKVLEQAEKRFANDQNPNIVEIMNDAKNYRQEIQKIIENK
ncbi:tetratricopeptide repeat protein [Comamonas sp. C24C]